MTSLKIRQLALRAAESAFDAHGDRGCSAKAAYSVMREIEATLAQDKAAEDEIGDSFDEAFVEAWDALALTKHEFAMFSVIYDQRYRFLVHCEKTDPERYAPAFAAEATR